MHGEKGDALSFAIIKCDPKNSQGGNPWIIITSEMRRGMEGAEGQKNFTKSSRHFEGGGS